jgi:hypothetical protein
MSVEMLRTGAAVDL